MNVWLSIAAALPVAIAVHELGHAAAAFAAGYRVRPIARSWPPGAGVRILAGRRTEMTPAANVCILLAGPAASLLFWSRRSSSAGSACRRRPHYSDSGRCSSRSATTTAGRL
ncbi:MAG TPA: M50 family metallopeptidase [Gaiellaceae bacterium]|jgi:hypothetical protein|nr:M50 family metallopeptidase [Gaiellaceae bacterium]